ncbi:MAG: hypothetical protein ACRDRH_01720 [Pseudonocardia sp.]
MTTTVIVGGLTILILLAVIVGISLADDRQSRRRAWRNIARERRRIREERHRLQNVDPLPPRCRDCPLRPDLSEPTDD